MNITFEEKFNGGDPWYLTYLDGRQVGVIKGVVGGWQYFPYGGTLMNAGPVFSTLAAVKRSITE